MMRVAELCAGYGGLHLGLLAAGWNVDLAWYAENDPDASKVMAAHHPAVPNLGDITNADWSTAEPVDIITAGYPCQPFSNAGKRKGFADERAIWGGVANAVRVLRPRLLLLENVDAHVVRGFRRVLGDLAALGYDATWLCVRASDLGAAHRRERLFVAAHPADADRDTLWPQPVGVAARVGAPVVGGDRQGHDRLSLLPTPAARDGDGRGAPDAQLAADRLASGRRNLDDAVALLPTPRARDHKGVDPNPRGGDLNYAVALLPTPTARDGLSGPGHASSAQGTPDLRTTVALLPTPRASDGEKGGPNQRGSSGDLALPSAAALLLPTGTVADHSTLFEIAYADRWGRYGAAIERWERILGRAVPEPTEPGVRGAPRLSPRFVEWLMGLPDGHVTDLIRHHRPDRRLSRNAALRVLGNGVVPLQAAAAFEALREVV